MNPKFSGTLRTKANLYLTRGRVSSAIQAHPHDNLKAALQIIGEVVEIFREAGYCESDIRMAISKDAFNAVSQQVKNV